MTTVHSPPRTRTTVVAIAIAGTLLVWTYAALALLQILVLNPQAAMPGLGLDQIRADMGAARELQWPPTTVGIMAVGPIAAAALLVLAIRRRLALLPLVMTFLVILSLGAFAYFAAAFGPGMSLADTYLISGGDVSPWALPLYAVSGASLVALVLVGIVASSRQRR